MMWQMMMQMYGPNAMNMAMNMTSGNINMNNINDQNSAPQQSISSHNLTQAQQQAPRTAVQVKKL
jgi:hypothetical protein